MRAIILGLVFFVSVASAAAEQKGKVEEDVKIFRPPQETIRVMDHVFEILK